MENIDQMLKDAILNNDIHFLRSNLSKYDINSKFSDEDNDTLLLYSISNPENDVYTFFLDHGADVTLVNNEGENIFHSIVYSGLTERIDDILNRFPHTFPLLNSQTTDGATPLFLSVVLEKDEIFNTLIDLSVDVNLCDYENNAPIHPACYNGNVNMVIKLIENGANLRVKTRKGNYPLAIAVNTDHDEIVKYIYKLLYVNNNE